MPQGNVVTLSAPNAEDIIPTCRARARHVPRAAADRVELMPQSNDRNLTARPGGLERWNHMARNEICAPRGVFHNELHSELLEHRLVLLNPNFLNRG